MSMNIYIVYDKTVCWRGFVAVKTGDSLFINDRCNVAHLLVPAAACHDHHSYLHKMWLSTHVYLGLAVKNALRDMPCSLLVPTYIA